MASLLTMKKISTNMDSTDAFTQVHGLTNYLYKSYHCNIQTLI